MADKNLKDIINEEVNGFDFLGMDQIKEDENLRDVVSGRDFQTKFVTDVVNNFNDTTKFKDSQVVFKSVSEDDVSDGEGINVEYGIDFTYDYDGNDLKISLYFDGDNVSNDLEQNNDPGNYFNEPDTRQNYKNIEWSNIDVKMFDDSGDEIDMKWLDKNPKLYESFVRTFIQPLLEIDVD